MSDHNSWTHELIGPKLLFDLSTKMFSAGLKVLSWVGLKEKVEIQAKLKDNSVRNPQI